MPYSITMIDFIQRKGDLIGLQYLHFVPIANGG